MTMLAAAILAAAIGYGVGMQSRWRTWHGPTAAVIVIPAALLSGHDPILSILAPICLAAGFLAAKVSP